MNPNFFSKAFYKGFFCILLLIAIAFTINSCKKNIATAPIADSKVLQAKTWYESTFPVTVNGKKNQLITQSVSGVSTTDLDYTQLIAPYWDKYTSYTRDNKEVVEVPLDPSASFSTTLSNMPGSGAVYKKEYSRTSFLIINDGQNTSAYIMTIIADSSYVKNDPSKLDNNKYNKHDADFSGVVLYHSPKGRFIKGWFYKNGKISYSITHKDQSNSAIVNGNKQQVQKLKTNDTYQVCTQWFQIVIVDGNISSPRYLDTYCSIIDDGAGGSGGSGGGAPTGGGGGYNPTDGGGGYPDGGTGTGTGTGGPRDIGFPPVDYDPSSEIDNLIGNNPDFLFNCDSVKLLQIASYNSYGNMYQNVANFHPDQTVINRINNLPAYGLIDPFYLQNLNSAYGSTINSDFFPVRITSLPTGTDMASLTEYFRLNMTNFTSGQATFTPYVDGGINDTQYFNQYGAQSVGALVHIGMFNNGTVVVSDYKSGTNGTYYKFSTMTSPLDYNHPVSGNREFGVYPNPDRPGEYTFYTMGVDRISDWKFALGDWIAFGAAFRGADNLWAAMQNNMINYINTHGGHAELYNQRSYTARPDYNFVKDYLEGRITLDQLKRRIGC